MKHRRSRLLTIATAGGLAALGLAVGPTAHVLATPASIACGDSADDVSILKSPITLGLELGAKDPSETGGDGHVALCYSTNPYGSLNPSITGGEIAVDVLTGPNYTNPNGNTANVACYPDSEAAGVRLSCEAGTTPTLSVSHPTGTTGDVLTVTVPLTVCAGPCVSSSPAVNATGVLVGQLTPVAEPGTGKGYQLSSLQVFVDGVAIVNEGPITAGAYVAPLAGVADSLTFSTGGPCVGNVCVPAGYVETTGNDVAGFQIGGLAFNVAVPKRCLYSNPAGQCP